MLTEVTNKARGARGFQLVDGTTHVVEPGASARLDLADHPLHRVWQAEGDVSIGPVAAVPSSDVEGASRSPPGEAFVEGRVPSRRRLPSGASRHPSRDGEG